MRHQGKRITTKLAAAAAAASSTLVLGALPAQAAGGLSAGDLVVYRVGTGAAALSSAATAVSLDDYTTSGTLAGTVALPVADAGAQRAVTSSGTATSEGLLSVSGDGTSVLATGYDAVPGTASVSGSTVARVVAVVGLGGTVDSQTTLGTAATGNNVRSAYATTGGSGSDVWVGTPSGVFHTTVDATVTPSALSSQNTRAVGVYGGQLYLSSSSGTIRVAALGSGTPTSGSPSPTELSGVTTTNTPSPYQFAFAGPNVLYVADSTNGIAKYVQTAGTWAAAGTVSLGTGAAAAPTGIAVSPDGTTIYATAPGGLYRLVDSSGTGT